MKKTVLLFLLNISIASLGKAQELPKPDTIEMGGVTIIRDNADTIAETPEKRFLKKFNTKVIPHRIKTEWAIVDIGFSNYVDNTNYQAIGAQAYAPGSNSSWFEIKPFKSKNINIWVLMQSFNVIDHFVNFKYGLGVELNNYRYNQPVRYDANPPATADAPVISIDAKALSEPPARIYRKNKLAIDYITVPVMLNFNLTPHRLYNFQVSTGISVGYLYASRNKTVTNDEGKLKAKDDFDLRHWKLSYIADVTVGVVTFYGSYAFKSIYKRGLNITPYTFGIRVRPMEIISKLESR